MAEDSSRKNKTSAAGGWQRKPSLPWAAVCLFLAVFFTMAFVYHPETGWNVNTRLDLVFAVVRDGTLSLDQYHDRAPYATGDKALFKGTYYSDKIFGVSLLALPFYWLGNLVTPDTLGFAGGHALMKTAAVAAPGAFAAALFFLLLARLGCPPRRAVALTAFSVFGTMWFGYGTVFYPYMPGLASALAALWLIFFPPARRMTPLNCFAIGLLLGYSLLCDLTFGLAVFGIGVIWLLRLADQGGLFGSRAFAEMTGHRTPIRRLSIHATTFWAGVLLPLSFFFAYCFVIFGEFTIPYEYEASQRFREGMAQGFMGVQAPELAPLYYMTLHPFRGLLFWSPIVLFGLAGCVKATREHGKRRLAGWLGIWCFTAYLVFNAGYYMWWGGWAMGPRLMIPMLPFVLLGLGEMARPLKRRRGERKVPAKLLWPATLAAGVLSLALSLPLSLYDPQIPQSNPDSVLAKASFSTDLYVPHWQAHRAFYSGRLDLWPPSRLKDWRATGEIGFGMHPLQKLQIWSETDETGRALGGYLFFFGIAGVLIAGAFWKAPEKIPRIDRSDFPFATIDGAAAPPPPGTQG